MILVTMWKYQNSRKEIKEKRGSMNQKPKADWHPTDDDNEDESEAF